jgi:hypothetical protein
MFLKFLALAQNFLGRKCAAHSMWRWMLIIFSRIGFPSCLNSPRIAVGGSGTLWPTFSTIRVLDQRLSSWTFALLIFDLPLFAL